MYVTQSNYIRGLSKLQYNIIRDQCIYSNHVFNEALTSIELHYRETSRYLRYEDNYHICKHSDYFKLIESNVGAQILKVADRAYKSYFNQLKKIKNEDYRTHVISKPKHRSEGSLFVLVICPPKDIVTKDSFKLPIGHLYRKLNSNIDTKILFSIPSNIRGREIKEIRIIPVCNGRAFKIQWIYKRDVEETNLDSNNALAIDLGVNNLAACVTTLGTSFLIDGRRLKSINQGYNKEYARLKRIAAKQGLKNTTNRMFRLDQKRNNRVNDYINKAARYIINYCLSNDIGTVVVGYNIGLKNRSNLSKRFNQTFHQIPFARFINKIEFLCNLYNILFVSQEESYTSKASFLDHDFVPIFSSDDNQTHVFSGKRICRGLYRSQDGTLINADINGAANTLYKSNQNFNFEKLARGVRATPFRILIN